MSARLEIRTRRQGVLGRVGHDLKLATDQITVHCEGAHIRAQIDARSLHVVCAMRGDTPDPRGVSRRDQVEIERNLHHTILRVSQHPTVSFDGLRGADGLKGTITLRGQCRPVFLPWRTQHCAHGQLDHRDFGIPVFTALLGTLRVDPVIDIAVWLPTLSET